MGIIKRRHTGNFSSIANAPFDDKRLSVEAKGTLAYLLTRHHNWNIHTSQIGDRLGMGRDKTYRVFQELISAGYMQRLRVKGANGQWDGYDYEVDCECGVASLPQPEKPSPEKPCTENQDTVIKKERQQRQKGNKDRQDSALPLFAEGDQPQPSAKATEKFIEETFKRFYAAYPRKTAPDRARKAWAAAIKKADPSVIIVAAAAYAKTRIGEDPKFTPLPATWLNDGRWKDQPPEPPPLPMTGRAVGII
jgi:hypothetical protein